MSKITKIYIPFEDFQKIPAFETITRVRREINSRGEYLPTLEEVRRKRGIKEQEFREEFSGHRVLAEFH